MIVLLDLDGTITQARKPIGKEEVVKFTTSFNTLKEKGFQIGVVTGSPLEFMLEQIKPLWGTGVIDFWMPCNGTILYKDGCVIPQYKVNMKDLLSENYNQIVSTLVRKQALFLESYSGEVSGTFIQYRGSMVNWAPIGRDEGNVRKDFTEFDKRTGYRDKVLKELLSELQEYGITCTKGGETSFDIYPLGWDKTHALKHFPGKKIYFIGDSIFKGGNDYTIAKASEKWYSTESPEQTLIFLEEIGSLKL